MSEEQQPTYRVVGVRHGGTRITLTEGLTLDRAEYVKHVLTNLVAFQELLVEMDDDPPAIPLRHWAGD